jgi:MFS family permease
MGISETVGAMGAMFGPLFGSLLYKFGGYTLPFYAIGGLSMFMAILIFVIFKLNPIKTEEIEDE